MLDICLGLMERLRSENSWRKHAHARLVFLVLLHILVGQELDLLLTLHQVGIQTLIRKKLPSCFKGALWSGDLQRLLVCIGFFRANTGVRACESTLLLCDLSFPWLVFGFFVLFIIETRTINIDSKVIILFSISALVIRIASGRF